jgi:DNA-3-methyladenine glycosylase
MATAGPGKLCAAMGVSLADDGADLTRPAGPIRIVDDGWPAPAHLITGPRVGISRATETPWRFRGRW